MPKKVTKQAPKISAPVPGQMVKAKLEGKTVGPFYYVQRAGDVATLQGKSPIEVAVKDLL